MGDLSLLHGGLAALDVIKSSQLRYGNLARPVHVPKSPGRRQMWTLGSQSERPRSAPVQSEGKYQWFFNTFLELDRCIFASSDSSCLAFWDPLGHLCDILGSSWTQHLGSLGSPLGHPRASSMGNSAPWMPIKCSRLRPCEPTGCSCVLPGDQRCPHGPDITTQSSK